MTVTEAVHEMEQDLIGAWDCVRVNAKHLEKITPSWDPEAREREIKDAIASLRAREDRLKKLIRKISDLRTCDL